MEYGCIGEHLAHSFSKEIHNALADYPYEITEIPKEKLAAFAKAKAFKAINVTIPYKEMIMPYLDYIDEHAKLIGAVNTVVNKDGRLCGYNTDFFGMVKLALHAGIDFKNKKTAIIGTGGTSKTAKAVATYLGAKDIFKVSRHSSADAISYDELYKNHTDVDIIINTTPVGMFPDCDKSPVDLHLFSNLTGVLDAVYNPLCTKLVMDAKKMNIPSECGLYMLVAQAVRASEIFIGTKYQDSEIDRVYKKILRKKENIVLVGMPGCGKSTVSMLLEEKTGLPSVDTDEIIESKAKMKIKDIISTEGEKSFRDKESDAVREVSLKNGTIIATGGGAILRQSNIEALKRNGKIYFIDRPLQNLIPTESRPLSSTNDDLQKRFAERYEIYKSVCDFHVDANCSAKEVADKIHEEFRK